MIISSRRGASGGVRGAATVAVFGSGLIGGSVLKALGRRDLTASRRVPVSWLERSERLRDLSEAERPLLEAPGLRMDLIWAAGRTGFGSSREEAAREREAFVDVCEWVRNIAHKRRQGQTVFHVVSSAGGLFEGQRFVGRGSEPRPLRPYGALKLEQEGIARSVCDEMPVVVYRPSSVYGYAGDKGRLGLVTTMISNTKTGIPTRIFGGLDTVRDYVHVDDVGSFIARKTAEPICRSSTSLLASGRPASLREVLSIIRRVVGRPLSIKLDPAPSNASDITFRASALPEDWRTTDIETGIRQVMRKLSQAYERAAHA